MFKKQIPIFIFIGSMSMTLMAHALEFGMPWFTPVSNRVTGMGGVAGAIEDESTDLTVLNFGNPAGLALGIMENSLHVNLNYYPDNTPQGTKNYQQGLNLESPKGGNKGLTYWLSDNVVISAEAEGSKLTYPFINTPLDDNKFQYSTQTGGLKAAVLLKELAIGAQVKYTQIKGVGIKPYVIDSDTFNKYEVSGDHLAWCIGAAYSMCLEDGESKVSVGVHLGEYESQPMVEGISQEYIYSDMLGGYNLKFDYDYSYYYPYYGTIGIKEKIHLSSNPMHTTGELLYEPSSLFKLGFWIDNETETLTEDYEYSAAGYHLKKDGMKIQECTRLNYAPVIRGKIIFGDTMKLNYSVVYSNQGSYTSERYSNSYASNNSYKYAALNQDNKNFLIGLGLQPTSETITLGLQFDQSRSLQNYKVYAHDYQPEHTDVSEFRRQVARVGLEWWVAQQLALRGGFSYIMTFMTGDTQKKYGDIIRQYSLGSTLNLSSATTFDLTAQWNDYVDFNLSAYDSSTLTLGIKQVF